MSSSSPWIQHIKAYQAEHGCTYREAMTRAKATYKKSKPKPKQKQKQKGDGIVDALKEGAVRVKDAIELGHHKDGPPAVRELVKDHGEDVIMTIKVCRKPVGKLVSLVANALSMGDLKRHMKKYSYDDMFHLYMILTIKNRKTGNVEHRLLEKNERVSVSSKLPADDGSGTCMETIEVGDILVGEFISKGMKKMGSKFYKYNAGTSNCQVFVRSMLDASGLLTPEIHDFVFQDVDELVKNNPLTFKIMEKITDAGARGRILQQGKGDYCLSCGGQKKKEHVVVD